MPAAPITIKLRCTSWGQLRAIYKRDLTRSALFLKSSKPPPLGTDIRVDLMLPTDSLIALHGTVSEHVPSGGLGGRGPGIDIQLGEIPASAMWLIEQALQRHSVEGRRPPLAPATATAAATQPSAAETDADAEDAQDIVEAEDDLIAALTQEYRSLRKLNPFQVLGIGYETTDQQVRSAFGQLTRRYHPDRFARYQSQEARKYASEIFILVRDAYRRLGNGKARERTLAQIELKRSGTPSRGTRPPTQRPQRTATPTPTSHEPASHTVRAGPAASPAFTPRTQPDRPLESVDLFAETTPIPAVGADEVQVSSGKRASAPRTYLEAEQHLDNENYDAALAQYRAGARLDPGDRAARIGVELTEGLIALAQRDRLEAAQRFEAVLELEPTNERAARQLAEMRRIATNERKGLLARLLGKGG